MRAGPRISDSTRFHVACTRLNETLPLVIVFTTGRIPQRRLIRVYFALNLAFTAVLTLLANFLF